MCLWLFTVTFSIHPDLLQPVEHKSSNTPSLVYNILFVKLQWNKLVSHLSGVPVNKCLPSTRVDFSETCSIKGPHNWNNRTVQLIEGEFILFQGSVSKHYFTFFLWCCNQTHGFGDSVLRFTDHWQVDTGTLSRTDSILLMHLCWHIDVMFCRYVETIKQFQIYSQKIFGYTPLILSNNFFWGKICQLYSPSHWLNFFRIISFLPGDIGKKWNRKTCLILKKKLWYFSWMYFGLNLKYLNFCSILITDKFSRQIFEKYFKYIL
jgi:hypothetical protein